MVTRHWHLFHAFFTFLDSLFIGAIPVGIAVARQRLQEHAQQQQQQQQHQMKDINRFGNIGIATDLGKPLFFNFFSDSSRPIVTDNLRLFCRSQASEMNTALKLIFNNNWRLLRSKKKFNSEMQ